MIDLSRSRALLGDEAVRRLASSRVLLVGVGGVGSWCAEALVRTGVGHLTLIDDDRVTSSNLNRQCPATLETVGLPKVGAMRARLLSIDPAADILAIDGRYPESAKIDLSEYDLILDAIDSVSSKAALILAATRLNIPVLSSMGAALRKDPTRVVVRKFDRIEGDGLARALRQHFKRHRLYPARAFTCVCSLEPPQDTCNSIRGSLMTVTCSFGMVLASEALRILAGSSKDTQSGSGEVISTYDRGINHE